MRKNELINAVDGLKAVTHDALQMIWDATNKGQRNKLLKNPDIAALLERYDVNTEEEVN